MSDSIDYKKAYERQKKAREAAEKALEKRASELYEAHNNLETAYIKLKKHKVHALQQEKLASLGQLVAGVAHEINNPNAFIKSNLNSLKKYQEALTMFFSQLSTLLVDKATIEPDDLKKSIQQLYEKHDLDFIVDDLDSIITDSIEGAKRVEDIVLGLKSFSRQDNKTPEAFDLHQCITNTLKLINNTVKYKADVVVNLGEIPLVQGFPGEMGQVLVNLIVNASQAINEKGTITIETCTANDQIEITISDTGSGIAPDIVDRIFDPFFTTKDVGKGTGLGLAITHNIIEKHKGAITLLSELGKGSCFTITLPICDAL